MTEFLNPIPPAVEISPTESERTYAMFTHLAGFLSYVVGPLAIAGPIVMWLIRKDESAYVNDHGREAVNFNISIWLYFAIAGVLVFACIGWALLPALVVFNVVTVIIAAVRANGGAFYRYPITIRFIPS